MSGESKTRTRGTFLTWCAVFTAVIATLLLQLVQTLDIGAITLECLANESCELKPVTHATELEPGKIYTIKNYGYERIMIGDCESK